MLTQFSSSFLHDAKSGIKWCEPSCTDSPTKPASRWPVWVGGIPFAPFTMGQALEYVERLIRQGRPCYFVTANLHIAMLAHQDEEMKSAILDAAFNVADGAPLVWLSRLRQHALPERVTGSDLVPALCERAASKGYRIFLLGGEPGVADKAADNLRNRYPGVHIVGTEAPPFFAIEEPELLEQIRAARPDLLFVSFGSPKGEIWLRRHYQSLGVPVCVSVGATIDFLAGRVPRAPRWLQRLGLEWAYRLYQEPRRLFLRYFRNMLFLLKLSLKEILAALRGAPRRERLDGNSRRDGTVRPIVQ